MIGNLLNVARLTGRSGIRKNVRVVEYADRVGGKIWVPVEGTVRVWYVQVSACVLADGSRFYASDEVFRRLPQDAKVLSYDSGATYRTSLPAGSEVLRVVAGNIHSAALWAVRAE